MRSLRMEGNARSRAAIDESSALLNSTGGSALERALAGALRERKRKSPASEGGVMGNLRQGLSMLPAAQAVTR